MLFSWLCDSGVCRSHQSMVSRLQQETIWWIFLHLWGSRWVSGASKDPSHYISHKNESCNLSSISPDQQIHLILPCQSKRSDFDAYCISLSGGQIGGWENHYRPITREVYEDEYWLGRSGSIQINLQHFWTRQHFKNDRHNVLYVSFSKGRCVNLVIAN